MTSQVKKLGRVAILRGAIAIGHSLPFLALAAPVYLYQKASGYVVAGYRYIVDSNAVQGTLLLVAEGIRRWGDYIDSKWDHHDYARAAVVAQANVEADEKRDALHLTYDTNANTVRIQEAAWRAFDAAADAERALIADEQAKARAELQVALEVARKVRL